MTIPTPCPTCEELREERDNLRWLITEANKRVVPGMYDTADGLMQVVRQLKRDNALMREALRRIASTDNEFSWSREGLARQALKAVENK